MFDKNNKIIFKWLKINVNKFDTYNKLITIMQRTTIMLYLWMYWNILFIIIKIAIKV